MSFTKEQLQGVKFTELLSIAATGGVEYTGQPKEVLIAQILGEEVPTATEAPSNPEQDLRRQITTQMANIKATYADLEPAKYRETAEMDTLLVAWKETGNIPEARVETLYAEVLGAFTTVKKSKGRTKEQMAELRAKKGTKEKVEKAPKEPKAPRVKKEKVVKEKVSRSKTVEVTAEMQAILDRDPVTSSKSSKMRDLSQLGMPVGQIATLVGAHYAFVYNTISQFNLKAQAAANAPATFKPLDEHSPATPEKPAAE